MIAATSEWIASALLAGAFIVIALGLFLGSILMKLEDRRR